jgi:hypothetical protein
VQAGGGGGGQSGRWRTLLANALDRRVVFSDRNSAFGAAIIAAESTGWLTEFAGRDRVQLSRAEPDTLARDMLAVRLSRFNELSAALARQPVALQWVRVAVLDCLPRDGEPRLARSDSNAGPQPTRA